MTTTALTISGTKDLNVVGNWEKNYLLFNSGLDIKVADLKTNAVDTLFSFKKGSKATRPAWLESLSYHDDNLWIGCAYIGIRNVKNNVLIPRAQTVFSLASYKGKLYDAGGYGICETLTNKVLVSENQLECSDVYSISDFLIHKGNLMTVCEWNVPYGGPHGHMIRYIERHGKIVAPHGGQPKVETHGLKRGRAISLDEGILSTLATTHVDKEEDWLLLNGNPVPGTHIKYAEYASLAYDSEGKMLYAAFQRPRRTWYESKQITAFEVLKKAGKVVCNPIKEIATNIPGSVLALLLVNEQQLASIENEF